MIQKDQVLTVFDEQIPDSVKMPNDAYLYFPSGVEIKNGEGKKGVRKIFEGQVMFDSFELEMLQMLKETVLKSKQEIKLDLKNWNDPDLLRFLQAHHFKIENTIKSLIQNEAWRKTYLPPKFTQSVHSFLRSGIAYLHGRDSKFRPILIISAYKINMENMNIEALLEGLSYLLQYTIHHLMLPGQVENWVIIIDLNFMGLFNLPLSNFKRVMEFVSSNYRGRLFSMYLMNSPTSIFIPWKLAKQFLDEITIQKIRIYKTAIAPELFSHTNKEQVEKRYGGSSYDLKEYWPPKFPSFSFYLNEKDYKASLITKEEYFLMFKQGLLQKNKVNQEFLTECKAQNETKSPTKSSNLQRNSSPPLKNKEAQIKSVKRQEIPKIKKKPNISPLFETLDNALFNYDERDDDEFSHKFQRIHETDYFPSCKKQKHKLKKFLAKI